LIKEKLFDIEFFDMKWDKLGDDFYKWNGDDIFDYYLDD
jgi:hypothetical protein